MLVIGEGGVGKTSTIHHLIYGQFMEDYDPPCIDEFYHTLRHEGDEHTNIAVMDTFGQEEFPEFTESLIKEYDGFILMYSIGSYHTFDEAQLFYEKISRIKEQQMSGFDFILVGNKVDLEMERQVAYEEAKKLAEKWNVPFYEQSAKNLNNVRHTFELLAMQMKQPQESETPTDNGCKSCHVL